MDITLLSNEYPPYTYGGAGVHVEYLSRQLAVAEGRAHRVTVLCFGDQHEDHGNLRVQGVAAGALGIEADAQRAKVLGPLERNLVMAGLVKRADIVHAHTWYAHLAGCLASRFTGGKLVLTTHSLEPHRPWKVEQLGSGYQVSSWLEKTAYESADGVVAVSEAMKNDVRQLYQVAEARIRVIPNGIDPDEYRPTPNRKVLESYGIDPDMPFILFVGRITRQKGIVHLVNAVPELREGIQIVLCAGQPDTREIGEQMEQAVDLARAAGKRRLVWIRKMVERNDLITLYTHASLFVCPSVYEPFGIINLEAMACQTPVVGTRVGGIPEIIVDGEHGLLVDIAARGGTDFEPADPKRFSRDLAAAVNQLLDDPARLQKMGRAARQRVEEQFSWKAVATRTLEFYREL